MKSAANGRRFLAMLVAFACALVPAQSRGDAPVARNDLPIGFRVLSVAGREAAVWYPTDDPEQPFQYDAETRSVLAPKGRVAAGSFPLVLFSHGYGGCGIGSLPITETLARRGYIVAAPDHRDARCRSDGVPVRAALQSPDDPVLLPPRSWSQAAYSERRDDIEALVDALLRDELLRGHLDASHMAIAGHSLGGYTALALAGAWSTWRDPRFSAVVALSPYVQPFLFHGGLGTMHAPVLYEGGSADEFTPSLTGRDGAFAGSNTPKVLVTFRGAGHTSWSNRACTGFTTIIACARNRPVVATMNDYIFGFLDRTLKGDTSFALNDKAPGVERLETAW